ncbi:putative xyloglucan endotransglucosylase/hydrolase protein 32 [Ananas comosus]|uniref:Xyloglucan endotransglucosylase/hydrolase n=1 Tax=Ananas comosus TaxID=4615 RepID=A0A199VVU8_ANACO|nr:putative xyloglucan endotransglucosylase/hydrolase protein 32 [Ananas comosus]
MLNPPLGITQATGSDPGASTKCSITFGVLSINQFPETNPQSQYGSIEIQYFRSFDTLLHYGARKGSGFKSNRPFRNGYFGASIKLQSGYTAGVITAFYLSNNQVHPGYHDEVDIEFLGTTPGRPYTLQTNVYVRGSGDGRIIGREMKFHLWFDPTAAFHNYAILWNQNEIIFFVDDIPIRRYPRKSVGTFPLRPMWLYASIWDASSWATDDGRSKADYRYQPFVAQFTRFAVRACSPSSPPRCHAPGAGGRGGLTGSQFAAMRWAQAHYMVYNYCRDPKRDHSLTPECF